MSTMNGLPPKTESQPFPALFHAGIFTLLVAAFTGLKNPGFVVMAFVVALFAFSGTEKKVSQ